MDYGGKQAEEVDQQTSHSQEEPMEDDTNVTYFIVEITDKSILGIRLIYESGHK